MFTRPRAMTVPGIVLSQPERAIKPSNIFPIVTNSMESAITSRLTRDAFIPWLPIVIPSEIDTVLNSIGVPPAARTPSFTYLANKYMGTGAVLNK